MKYKLFFICDYIGVWYMLPFPILSSFYSILKGQQIKEV